MICKNCNSEMPEGGAFCPVCGQKAEAEGTGFSEDKSMEPAEDKVAESEEKSYFDFDADGQKMDEKPPKKGKGKVIGIVAAAVLVLLIGIGVTVHAQFANFFKKNFSSAAEYYQYVEKENRDAVTETFSNQYKAFYDSLCADEWKKNVSYKLELGQTLKTMMSMTGADFSALNDAGIVVSTKKSGDISQSQIRGCINGQDLITMNLYVDVAKNEGYMQVPEFSSKYLDLSKELETLKNSNLTSGNMFLMGGTSYLPEPKNISSLLTTYSDIAIDKMDSVEKSSGELEAGEVKGNYTKFTVTCKGKKIYNMFMDMLNTMKNDQNMKAIADKFGDGAYDSFSASVQKEIEDFKSQESQVTDEQLEMLMDVYVSDDGKIVGRVINLCSKDDETHKGETLKMTFVKPENGSEVGTELSFAYNDVTYVSIIGKGIRKDGKISGEYKLSLDESINPSEENIISTKDLVTIKVADLEEDKLKEGYLNGSVTLSSSGTTFSSYSLQFDLKGDKENKNNSVSVICGGDKLVTFTLLSDQKDVPEIKKPGEGDELCDISDNAAMEEYIKEVNPENILGSIKEKCGVDLEAYAKAIESLMEGVSPVLPYGGYSYDGLEDDLDDLDLDDLDPDDYSL